MVLAPAAAPAPAAPSAAGLAPRVEVVDGQMRIVEQSLSIQAQPEAGARLITVEDNPVSVHKLPFWWHTLSALWGWSLYWSMIDVMIWCA